MNETIDVVVITYCSAKYVLQTLESIYAQTYTAIRLIVSDDCSKDNTVSLCRDWIEEHKERFVATEIIESPQNQGAVFNCQRAFSRITAAYYAMTAGDDYWAPTYLEKCMRKYQDRPEAGFVFVSSNIVYQQQGRIEKEDISAFREGDIFEDLMLLNFWPKSGGFLFRTEAMRSVGGYNTSIWVEDFDYALRIAQLYPIGWVRDYEMYYRLHDANAGGDSIRLLTALEETLLPYISHPLYSEAMQRLEARLIAVAKKENLSFLLHRAFQKRSVVYIKAYLHAIARKFKSNVYSFRHNH